MSQERLLSIITSVLLMGGFRVSEKFSMRTRSFDMVARKRDVVLVIKAVTHIDSVIEETARDLDRVARYLKGSPLIIGERARDSELERGAVYIRYGIYAISVATLYDAFVERVPPLVYASPGGLYVNINGDVLRELRERKNLSLGDLGSLLGVSRRTISKYESGMGTTLDIAQKIEEIFDAPLVVAIDLLAYKSIFSEETERPEEIPMNFWRGSESNSMQCIGTVPGSYRDIGRVHSSTVCLPEGRQACCVDREHLPGRGNACYVRSHGLREAEEDRKDPRHRRTAPQDAPR